MRKKNHPLTRKSGFLHARVKSCKRRNKVELDRIDKTLFILPFVQLADVVSTQYSLAFGGKEGGFLARPVYERHGEPGLLALPISAFFASLGCVCFLRYAKRRITPEQGSKPNRVILVYAVLLFFLLEAYLMGVVVQNFLVPLSFPSLELFVIQYAVALAYFVAVCFVIRIEMKKLIRF